MRIRIEDDFDDELENEYKSIDNDSNIGNGKLSNSSGRIIDVEATDVEVEQATNDDSCNENIDSLITSEKDKKEVKTYNLDNGFSLELQGATFIDDNQQVNDNSAYINQKVVTDDKDEYNNEKITIDDKDEYNNEKITIDDKDEYNNEKITTDDKDEYNNEKITTDDKDEYNNETIATGYNSDYINKKIKIDDNVKEKVVENEGFEEEYINNSNYTKIKKKERKIVGKITVISKLGHREGSRISDAKINLYALNGLSPKMISSKFTDKNGVVIFDNLAEGSYRVIEIVNRKYFEKPTYIEWNEVTIDDELREESIIVINKVKHH